MARKARKQWREIKQWTLNGQVITDERAEEIIRTLGPVLAETVHADPPYARMITRFGVLSSRCIYIAVPISA